jgi:3-hydroxy-9,10-secoandrosta-1,3,5(10)-triene-9,17-dione monooxygenase reductase component
MHSDSFNPQEYRKTLGQFATGVTIITTTSSTNESIGITVNSFNSVSMDPPLVLWSIAKSTYSLKDFQKSNFFNVHILSDEDVALSSLFASVGDDKFKDLNYKRDKNNIPLLSNCPARFQCKTVNQYEGGDHIIFIGQVLTFDRQEMTPLLFHDGSYATCPRRLHQQDKK